MITFRKTSWIFLTSVHLKKWKKEKSTSLQTRVDYTHKVSSQLKEKLLFLMPMLLLCIDATCLGQILVFGAPFSLQISSLEHGAGRAAEILKLKRTDFWVPSIDKTNTVKYHKILFLQVGWWKPILKNLASHENIVLWSILFHKNIQLPLCNKAISDTLLQSQTPRLFMGKSAARLFPQWKRGLNSQLSKFRTQKIGIVREETIPCWSAKNWIKIGFLEQVKTPFNETVKGNCNIVTSSVVLVFLCSCTLLFSFLTHHFLRARVVSVAYSKC